MTRHPLQLDRESCVLVVVDMQEPFLSSTHERDRVTANVRMLVQAAKILSIPILATLQYSTKMGPTVPEIASLLPERPAPMDKLCFSCAGCTEFSAALRELHRRQVLLCGLETHICISQTAHDLLHAEYQVHVAADAVSARTQEKHKLGMERMRDAGVRPCAAEAAIYEWMVEAGTPQFKEVLKLVK